MNENHVYLADLLQSHGHQLYHVLASSGWKTHITVHKVVSVDNSKADILNGVKANVQKSIVMQFFDGIDGSDTGRTQA